MASDVGAHNSQIQEINAELTSSKSPDSARLLEVVVKLVEANQHLQEKLASTEQKLGEQTERMQTLLAETRTDALTLLANRRAFDDELAERFAEFRRQGRTFSLTVVDVDRFKNFNDAYGHRAGDELLRNVSKLLRRNLRETDLVARYGGDEFAIVQPDTDLASACESARRACATIENYPFSYDGKRLRVTASLGVAEVQSDEDAAETVKRADEAVYASKNAGRNCVHVHDGNVVRRVDATDDPAHSTADVPQQDLPMPRGQQAEAAPDQEAEGISPADSAADPENCLDLSGRTLFCQQVRNRIAEWKRGGPTFSVALIKPCGHFKNRSDSDQRARDLGMRVTARLLAAAIRDMDVLGSYAPGCFALMLPAAGLADAAQLADRILEVLSEPIILASGEQPTITLSVGVVQATESDDATSVLKRAEMALEAALGAGPNRVYRHNGETVEPIPEIQTQTAACPA